MVLLPGPMANSRLSQRGGAWRMNRVTQRCINLSPYRRPASAHIIVRLPVPATFFSLVKHPVGLPLPPNMNLPAPTAE